MKIKNIFSTRLKGLRNQHNLTILELASRIKVSIRLIKYYEDCKSKCLPTASRLVDLSLFFNCSVDYLLGLTDNIKTNN
ncbi:MAG: helix-turn-helix domain-containing protein [Clostridiales bacterium]|jgi:transcriptional regulator with XRE-family HTH domain|nr:helix-turn-helix domain-containing protein [Clostridiales bacterium]